MSTRCPRFRPSLERLEDRYLPANVQLFHGALLISPGPSQSALGLTLTQTAVNTFSVIDRGKALGSYGPVANVAITGGNGDDTVTVNVGQFAYAGSLYANTGNGNDGISLQGAGGALLGNVTLLTGNGADTVALNRSGGGAMTFGGAVRVLGGAGSHTANLGNAGGPTHFGGSLDLVGFNNVSLGAGGADTLGGSVTVRSGANPFGLNVFVSNRFFIAHDLTAIGGAGNDTVTFEDGGALGGNLTADLGGGRNELNVGGNGPAVVVGGSVRYTAGDGDDTIDLANNASIGGDLFVDLGGGNNTMFFDQPLSVGGNMSVNLGNGTNAWNGGVNANVGGDLSVTLGNGNNHIVVYPRTTVGGTFRLRSGNGNTALTFNNSFAPAPVHYRVDVLFGSGDDSFTLAGGLGGGSGSLSGTVDGGGRINGNVFDQGPSWALLPDFRLVNFP